MKIELYSAKRQWGTTSSPRVVGAIFGVLGLGLLIGGAFAYSYQRAFLKRAVAAEGTVVEVKRERKSDGSAMHRSVVQFAAGGQMVRFEDSVSSSPARHAVGERVAVLHEPGNPRDASIDSFMNRWLATLILGIMGGAFSVIGAGLVVFGRRSAGSSPQPVS